MSGFGRTVAELPIVSRFVVIAALSGAMLGGLTGLIVGLIVYAPTAWFAVFEAGVPATIVGAALGFVVGLCTLGVRRIGKH